jgi:ectoine hydroxylase-related dioxygenase (phytanoyl-CoA dioxygenase family)
MSTATLAKLPRTASVDEVVTIIERDGGVIIEDFLASDVLASVKEDLATAFDEIPFGEDEEFAGKRTRRASRLFGRVRNMSDIALHPLYVGAAEKILRKPTPLWVGQNKVDIVLDLQIGVTQGIEIHPGQGTQPLHRDDMMAAWRHPQYGREARVQIMLAVTDFTEENGGTRVIPGSHKWDDDRMPLNEETVPTIMSAGSALLWIGSVYHGGGNNTSDAPRTGLSMAYDLACLRSEENHFLSLSVEEVAALPVQIQRMLGWSAGENYSGWVEIDGQMADPQQLLATPEDVPNGVGLVGAAKR